MALFKGDILIAGTNPSGGGGAGGGHVIQDYSGVEFEQRPALKFIGADIVDNETDEATQVITPSFREIQGDIPDTNLVCLDGIPIGGIIPYGAPINTLSQDWLPCLGQAVSRTFYHELFEKYGTIYGDGDGSTTFNLPNYGGRVPVGLDENDSDFDTLGAKIGEKEVTLTIAQMPRHSGHVVGNLTTAQAQAGTGVIGTSNPENIGGGEAHSNIQPSIVANYIVKAKTSSHTITTSNVMTVHNESDENTYSCDYMNETLNGFNFYLDSNSVTIEPKVDVYALVEASWGIWGFAGAEIGLIISTPEGATQVDFFNTRTNGHDTEAVPVTAVGKYILPAGGKYTFGVGANTSSLGGVKGSWIKAITIPKTN